MIKFSELIRTQTYIELDAEDGGKMFMPTSQTIFVDDNSNAISVKTTGSRKTIGVVISGGTPPVPPEPFTGIWKATYNDGHIESGDCSTSTYGIVNLEDINDYANVLTLEIGECATEISDYWRGGFTSLTSLTIADNVTAIGRHSFDGCESLKYVELGSSIRIMRNYVFRNCPSVETFICKAVNPPSGDDWEFLPRGTTYKIYVPDESVDRYKANGWWRTHQGQIYPMSQKP